MEARKLADSGAEPVRLEDHPVLVELKRDVHNLRYESRESAEMFGRIMQTLNTVSTETATMSGTLKTFMAHTDRRFDDLRNDVLRQCVVRHSQVDGRIDKLETKDQEIVREVRDMSDESKVQYIESLRSQLDERKKKLSESAKEDRDNDTYWKRYRVTVIVGVLMAVLGAGFGLISSKLNRPPPSFSPSPAASGSK